MTARPQEPTHLGTIAFVVDDRLSRQRSLILTRIVNTLRTFAKVDLVSAVGGVGQDELLTRLETQNYSLILVPWYRYLTWSKVEGFYGLTRTTGPTFAGYFCESLMPYEIGEQAEHYRAILLDFAHLDVAAIRTIVKSLIVDTRRSGLRPLLQHATPIYRDAWMGGLPLGSALEGALSTPELKSHDWNKHVPAFRACVSALWSMIYEEGPGKAEMGLARIAEGAGGTRVPRAFFQVAVDQTVLLLRLYFNMSTWTPRDALRVFWPDPKSPLSPYQTLARYADFVRVHTIPEPADVEVTVGLFPESAAEKGFGQVHTLWVEPLAAHIVQELPFDVPGVPRQADPDTNVRPFPEPASSPADGQRPASPTGAGGPTDMGTLAAEKARRFILEAADKVRELKTELEGRDETIRELRSGGVGTARPMSPPDMEAILDAFQEKYYETKFQIQELETQIAKMEREGTTRDEIETVRRRVAALTNREQAWLKKISQTLEAFRKVKVPPSRASGE